ncbi:PHD [Musa troglodytarum]|uniref:PHD n=1 Tax=Musa troglodytarum TaxID=320322 RepID=A0A9E7EMY5_9LILI|nr:PHD [Musa troglodytarum]
MSLILSFPFLPTTPLTSHSDEKYQQFQAEQNLQYKCAACRGDCYQVKDIDDAVRELWKRKDIADHDSIASLRAAAGLPSHEVAYSISPYSGDEQSGPIILKHDNNKPLKFSLKGISDKSSEYGNTTSNKKQVKKKGYRIKLVGKREEAYPELGKQDEARSLESSYRDQNIDEMTSFRPDGPDTLSSSTARDPNASVVKSCTNQLGTFDQSMTKEPASSNADMIPKVKIKNTYEKPQKSNGNVTDECDLNATDLSVERMNEANFEAENDTTERSNKVCQKKHSADIYVKPQRDNSEMSPADFTSSSSKDLKTSLKLKFKNPCFEQKSSWASHGEEENTVKGQRSKRKRPSTETMGGWQDDRSSKLHLENLIDEAMDANWILQKLGKDAIGKRIEVQSTNSSWHQGVVIDVNQSTSSLSVHLDDGRSTLLELGKQGIRFISQKQRTKS